MRRNPTQPTPPGRAVRTVVLAHRTPTDTHYDWMLEDPAAASGCGPLVTFRLTVPPVDWRITDAIVAVRLADHRRAYLSYVGPISGNRGRVRRVDAGSATVHQFNRSVVDATLGTDRFAGRVRLTARHGVWIGKCLERGRPAGIMS